MAFFGLNNNNNNRSVDLCRWLCCEKLEQVGLLRIYEGTKKKHLEVKRVKSYTSLDLMFWLNDAFFTLNMSLINLCKSILILRTCMECD